MTDKAVRRVTRTIDPGGDTIWIEDPDNGDDALVKKETWERVCRALGFLMCKELGLLSDEDERRALAEIGEVGDEGHC